MLEIIYSGLAVFGLVMLIVVGVDAFCFLHRRLKKEKPVSYEWSSVALWGRRVEECAEWMASHQQIVRIFDNTRYILFDELRRLTRFRYCVSGVQMWQYAVLNASTEFLAGTEVDHGFAFYLRDKNGLVSNSEAKLFAENYLKTISELSDSDGLISYRRGSRMRYVDVLPFACPALFRLSALLGRDDLVDVAKRQLDAYEQYGVVREFGVYAHAYDSKLRMPAESISWGRGVGWLALALLFSYQECCALQLDYAQVLRERLSQLALNVLRLQHQSGGWCTQLVSCHNYDSSATAIFAYVFVEMYALFGDEKYLNAARKGLQKLMSVTRTDGRVLFGEGDAHGVGNYSHRYSAGPFTQGMTAMLVKSCKRLSILKMDEEEE